MMVSCERSNVATVSIVIPGDAANLDFVRLLVTEARQVGDLALDEPHSVDTLWQARSVTTEDAAPLAQKPECTAIARAHSFARRVHCVASTAWLHSEFVKRDAPIAPNLRELGYGG